MISIITCSIKPDQYRQMKASFEANTSKKDLDKLEFIRMDRPKSIATGYNKAIKKSHGEILCFIHEDTRCRQHDWYKQVTEHFKNEPNSCIAGMVGTIRLHYMGAHWMSGPQYGRGRLMQGESEIDYSIKVPKQNRPNVFRIVSVDGFCFFADKKKLLKLNKGEVFDERYKYFHFYDTDICLAAREAGYDNYVFDHCLFQHLSIGNTNLEWHKSQQVYWQKWGKLDHLIELRPQR